MKFLYVYFIGVIIFSVIGFFQTLHWMKHDKETQNQIKEAFKDFPAFDTFPAGVKHLIIDFIVLTQGLWIGLVWPIYLLAKIGQSLDDFFNSKER